MKTGLIWIKAKTALDLGITNVIRVLFYQAQLRLKRGAAAVSATPIPPGIFFNPAAAREHVPEPPPLLPLTCFGWRQVHNTRERAPDWLLNPLTGKRADARRPWYEVPDFDPIVGDIKWIWELSRFDWTIRLAQHAVRGDSEAIPLLNSWLSDWLTINPAYNGPNWKCGQETSLRLMHLAFAARLLDQISTTPSALQALIRLHLRRISPTVGYAIGQDNNHGTSEAAGLFIGGSWLTLAGDRQSHAFTTQGRAMLEERVAHLVMPDGSFSQYSVNYHRLMLDTLSMAELWRRTAGEVPFSARFYERARAATNWLQSMVDPLGGDAANIGHNDGARLLQLMDGYRDFRPSVQLANALFHNAAAFAPGPWDDHLRWLGIEPMPLRSPPPSRSCDDGGFAFMSGENARVIARYPRFKFRPAQADALHVDLWLGERNVLRDNGTYSYYDNDANRYFAGTAAHNTITFDGRDQMPRLSRFLFGAWLQGRAVKPVAGGVDGELTWQAAYTDWRGAYHRRHVTLRQDRCIVLDEIGGFDTEAALRWHLAPGQWTMNGRTATDGVVRIAIESSAGMIDCNLTEAHTSLYFGAKNSGPALEARASSATTFATTITFSDKT